ncbi:hypothetical protein ONZ43_g4477 [Nemania bipapillata]|uniref:Uncharacterized protein n=1 Tax=Nemania bipapillata TaxID=110536 RepID=A0ACC2IM33_9PEZI|nr:hypothetical protein ONZ43_g4477 [Nemania bipapillata]
MCKIVCNITYRCGHTEPWVESRACQLDEKRQRKPTAKDPLCLLYRHCSEFGRVRQVKLADKLLCNTCFISSLNERNGMDPKSRESMIRKARDSAEFHANFAKKCIAESEKRARLGALPIEYINKVSRVALERLDIAFADPQMEPHHFEELLQVIVGLPFLDKGPLVEKFAGKIEQKLGSKKMRYFYALSMKYRNFGDEFRKGLKNPTGLDKA